MAAIAHSFLNFFTSLRLTVVCLTLALGLVFIGTLAQVKWGLYMVQQEYFRSAFVWWQPQGAGFKIPVWPGGYLLGWLLLINLIAAHIKRFEVSRKKVGIFIIHGGLILLLLGQFLTELFQVESFMAIPEGGSRNYSENGRMVELAIVNTGDPQKDRVYSVPQTILRKQKEIKDANLPFTVRVQSYFENSTPTLASGGLKFEPKERATAMDDRDIPVVTVEIETDEGKKGPFTVSNWLVEDRLVDALQRNFGSRLSADAFTPPKFTYKGQEHYLALRPERYYKPFTIALVDFTHERYKGTEIPKNFSSRVRVSNPTTREDREVLIYMNNPLRYGGETYYQGGFDRDDTVTILQVVRNPSWLTPYIACILVGVGLLVQFLSHLVGFAKKRSA